MEYEKEKKLLDGGKVRERANGGKKVERKKPHTHKRNVEKGARGGVG